MALHPLSDQRAINSSAQITRRLSLLVPHSSFGSPISGPAKDVTETHQLG